MGLPEIWRNLGPGLAGAVFGAGWWFWFDAVVCSEITVPFLHYLPGIFASLASLMFNCVRRDELQDYSPFDDGEGCRSRTWLFLSYVIAFVSLAGSAGMLVQDALLPDTPSSWTGVAGVLQCTCVLASGLMYWTSRTATDT
ncbi:hypothetical protein CY35_02G151400 [Sphagnum magellanicum]|jgi:hypothetical protein|nr:hypothetical protein CY35_02G151400 [Sphagnum magellanicum]